MSSQSPVVAVFGSSTAREHEPSYALARDLGRALAERGAAVMTGGYGGLMEACSRGAHEAGGHVVGVTVELFERRGPVNRYVRERVHTPDLYERLRYLNARADGFVAVPGSIGTLTEVFLTWTLLSVGARPSAPLVLCGPPWRDWLAAHKHPDLVVPHLFDRIVIADTADEAARLALAPVPAA